MVEQALRDPISVKMLKIDGGHLMDMFHMKPGPKIGYILNALLEEVLDDATKNTQEYLNTRTQTLLEMPENELKMLGEAGKQRREEAEDEEIKHIMDVNHVC